MFQTNVGSVVEGFLIGFGAKKRRKKIASVKINMFICLEYSILCIFLNVKYDASATSKNGCLHA